MFSPTNNKRKADTVSSDSNADTKSDAVKSDSNGTKSDAVQVKSKSDSKAVTQSDAVNAVGKSKPSKRKPKKAEDAAELYRSFCMDRETDHRLIIDGLARLQKKLYSSESAAVLTAASVPASTAVPVPAAAAADSKTDSKPAEPTSVAVPTDAKTEATDAKTEDDRNAVLYNLFFKRRSDRGFNFEKDGASVGQSDYKQSARQLKPVSTEDIMLLTKNLENELAFMKTEYDIRTFADGLTTGAAKAALRMQRDVQDLLSTFDSEYRPPFSDDDEPEPEPLADGESNKTDVKPDQTCAGCGEQKICSKINAWINTGPKTAILEFDFAAESADTDNDRRKFETKGDDWLCCHCGVAVLHCLMRNELVTGLKNKIRIDLQSVCIGSLDCGCQECGDDPCDILDAYNARILKIANDDDDGSADDENDCIVIDGDEPADRPAKKLKITARRTGPIADAALVDTALKTKPTDSAGTAAAVEDL